MPLYDYVCEDCGITEERLVKFEDRDSQLCDKCKKNMQKQIGIPNYRPFPEYAKRIEALGGDRREIGGFRDMRQRAKNNFDGDQHRPLIADNLPTAQERKDKIERNSDRNRFNPNSRSLRKKLHV